jgi:hypothetical protein
MGTLHRFPGRHVCAATFSRAASWAKRSDVTPAALAFSVERTPTHHSEGILSRFHHLITAQLPAPTSEAIASRESQSSMMERNESKLDMSQLMGPIVPKIKAIMSHDRNLSLGHSVLMEDDVEKIAESAWRQAFCLRLKEVQGDRSQEDMADLLGISRDNWNKYVNRGSAVPERLLPKIAKIGARPLEWLIEGPKAEKSQKPRSTATQPPKQRKRA